MSTTDEQPQSVPLSLAPLPQTSQPRLPRYLVGFSTKAYFDLPRTVSYLQTFLSALPSLNNTDSDTNNDNNDNNNNQGNDLATFILPSYPFIPIVAGLISSHHHNPSPSTAQPAPEGGSSALTVWHGAQNTHPHPTGASTGEVPPLMLRQLGCTLVCLGHAERRAAPFFETDEVVAKKAVEVVRQGMVPLVCIGEKERPPPGPQGIDGAIRFCAEQVSEVLAILAEDLPGWSTNHSVVFAYEPIWAIGASEPAGKEHVCAVIKGLKGPVKGRAGLGWRGDLRWLYGGSAGPGVWEGLKEQCDGLFLGRFAHEPERFLDVIKEVRGL